MGNRMRAAGTEVEMMPPPYIRDTYRKVRSDGPPSAKLDRLYCPSFDFDTDNYGLQIPNQGLVNHLNAIFFNVKVK